MIDYTKLTENNTKYTHEGVKVKCPWCGGYTFVGSLVKNSRCINCDMELTLHVNKSP